MIRFRNECQSVTLYQTGATTLSSQTAIFLRNSIHSHLDFLERLELWNWDKYDDNFLPRNIQFLETFEESCVGHKWLFISQSIFR